MVDIFISQPMRGRTDAEIREQRNECFARVAAMYLDSGQNVREVPSYFGDVGREQMDPLECLGKSIELMSHADVAVFCPGWKEARGCRIEHECAVQYGLEVIELL